MRVLMIDNYDSFTYNLVHLFEELGAEVIVRRNDAITPDEAAALEPDRLVVSPGPGRPADAGVSVEVIRRLGPATPTLGVCLGHQAIVEAFGGEVGAAQALLHGKASSVRHDGRGVFAGLPQDLQAGRYHSLAATLLPEELEVTARTDDGEVMGVRHRTYPIEGVQFHPESVLTPDGPAMARNFLSASWRVAEAVAGGGTVLEHGPPTRGASAARGGAGAGLRPAGGSAGQEGET
jgi:anthranilate synthase/aminodeoxychorismate synthase-like glutamine amidotransferase